MMNIYLVRDEHTLEVVYANSAEKAVQLFRDYYGVSGVASYVADDPERKREMLAGRTTPIYQLAELLERLVDERDAARRERDDALAARCRVEAEAQAQNNMIMQLEKEANDVRQQAIEAIAKAQREAEASVRQICESYYQCIDAALDSAFENVGGVWCLSKDDPERPELISKLRKALYHEFKAKHKDEW